MSRSNVPAVDTDNDDDLTVSEKLVSTPNAPAVAAPAVDINALAGAIVTAVNDAQGVRKVTIGEYQRTRSLHRDKPELKRKCFQNGIALHRSQLSKEAIEMLNELQPAFYCDGVFRVVLVQDGTTARGIDIQYSNKTPDQRMQNKAKWPTFEHMLAAMLSEMKQRRGIVVEA